MEPASLLSLIFLAKFHRFYLYTQFLLRQTIPFPIVSVSSLCSKNNLVLFSSQSATIIPKNDLILSKFNSFLDFVSQHSPTISAPLDPIDNLYKLSLPHLAKLPVITDSFNLPVSLNSVHRYSTIKTRTIAEDVGMMYR